MDSVGLEQVAKHEWKEMHSKLVEDHNGESEKILAGEDTSAARSFRGDTTSMHAGF